MSGAEAGFVVGFIASVISIIEATKTVYDAAKDAKGQPEAFRQVAARLPLVIEILHSAEERAQAIDEAAQEALEPILESCKAKAENLKKTFQKVIRKDDDKWYDRYKKALGTLRKGDKVECLMEGILKDIQLLACERLKGTATEAQMKELEEAIKEMNEMPPSLPDEAGSVTQNHQGSGNNNANTGRGAQHNGTGDLYHNEIKGDAYFGNNQSDLQTCLQDLRTTDPREDKKRIEQTKGGLLEDSYRWILEHSDFQQWRDDKQSRLLWIKGDPGKGKTMLLCGIVNEMSPLTRLSDKEGTTLLSYFFCQATDPRINSATAVLRGLIYLLIDQQPELVSHVRKKYDQGAKKPFEGVNAWVALSTAFENIIQDPSLKTTYLIVDALDECELELPLLLDLISQTSSSSRVKWLLSSRNRIDIERGLRLKESQMRLSLELKENAEQISHIVDAYIDHCISELAGIQYEVSLQDKVRDMLQRKSGGTFLWVALVVEELKKVESWEVLEVVNESPTGLDELYGRIMEQIQLLGRKKPKLCLAVLSAATAAYRPLHLAELGVLSGLPSDISSTYESIATIVNMCGSLLTIRDNIVYTIHQSAQDFLSKNKSIFPSGIKDMHYVTFSRSLQIMSRTLRRDVYSLRAPGISINQVKPPDPDPLGPARYSCLYWVDHLLDCDTSSDLKDSGSVDEFLRQRYLYWLEALSLMRSLSSGIVIIRKLENRLKADESPDLYAFIHDAKRFARYYQSLIEKTPLQLYCSALVFAPDKSIVRRQFEKCIPPWIQRKPKIQAHWNAALQTLEGHSDLVTSVAFSPDGKQVVSGSYDKTVRLWDAATGAPLHTLEGHFDFITSVAFSPDSKQVVSGSDDKTVRLWDATIGAPLQTLEGHSNRITSVAFSPDGKEVVSGSYDKTVRLWDAATGALLQTLEGHSGFVTSVAFSPDGKQVVSGSYMIVRLWDAATGAPLQTLEGHSDLVTSVAFSPDGKEVVSGSYDKTVRLWDTTTGAPLQTLESYSGLVTSVAFSPDGKQVVSGSDNKTVRLWDAATGAPLQTLEGHSGFVTSVAFSPDSKEVVSGSYDKTVRLWDAATGAPLQTLEGHSDFVTSVAFSPDGKQVVSGSYKTVRLWDAATGAPLQTLEGHSDFVTSVAFSPDGKEVVSGSYKTVRLWDAATGAPLQTLEGHFDLITSVAFPLDGKLLQTLRVSRDWVVEGFSNVLWLPPDYRPTCHAIWNGITVLGHSSGRVSFFKFAQEANLII